MNIYIVVDKTKRIVIHHPLDLADSLEEFCNKNGFKILNEFANMAIVQSVITGQQFGVRWQAYELR